MYEPPHWTKPRLAPIARKPDEVIAPPAANPSLAELAADVSFMRRNVQITMEQVLSLMKDITDLKDGLRMMAEQVVGLTARVDAMAALVENPLHVLTPGRLDPAEIERLMNQPWGFVYRHTGGGMPRELFTEAMFRQGGGEWRQMMHGTVGEPQKVEFSQIQNPQNFSPSPGGVTYLPDGARNTLAGIPMYTPAPDKDKP